MTRGLQTLQAVTLSTNWVCVKSGICYSDIVCVCAHYTSQLPGGQNRIKNISSGLTVTAHFLVSAVASLSASLALRFTRSHKQQIRGQKRVTFAYLVSRVTRKKLSSGASIQLGRLLRIMTPPRVFPLLLLRPLCCENIYIHMFIHIFIPRGSKVHVRFFCYISKMIRLLPGEIHLLYLGFLQDKNKNAESGVRKRLNHPNYPNDPYFI